VETEAEDETNQVIAPRKRAPVKVDDCDLILYVGIVRSRTKQLQKMGLNAYPLSPAFHDSERGVVTGNPKSIATNYIASPMRRRMSLYLYIRPGNRESAALRDSMILYLSRLWPRGRGDPRRPAPHVRVD
jgi:hypothetical protein